MPGYANAGPEGEAPRRPDGGLATEGFEARARSLRHAALRGALLGLVGRCRPQNSMIIGTPTPATTTSSGRPSRQ